MTEAVTTASLTVGVEQAAALLGVSTDTVRRLIETQDLPAFRAGAGRVRSKILIRRAALEDFITKREAQGVA